ncbi:unnamed protein product [Nezara viridula]|uniref:Uncharacterized protein n=1 Tax=Nezara viridula TaxID=85310 RepID=A0A9P0E5R7_NEZVI|nr:unnamed protein product [Nezara viridula]
MLSILYLINFRVEQISFISRFKIELCVLNIIFSSGFVNFKLSGISL